MTQPGPKVEHLWVLNIFYELFRPTKNLHKNVLNVPQSVPSD